VNVKNIGRRRLGVAAEHPNYKWWALSCTSLGMLLATLNSGTLIIALPDLERSLRTPLLTLVWVILAYMIASTVLVLTAGRLSDLFGRKKAYVGSFILFSLASLGAGFSSGGTELILWRILQGIGGAFLFANAPALVTDAFPKDQLGIAMGTNTMVAAIGLVLGPVLGGALVAISWHWVFWFNVPLGLLGALWGGLVLHELAKQDTQRGFDLLEPGRNWYGLPAPVWLAHGMLASTQGRWDEATRAFEQAISINRQYRLPYDEAKVLREYGLMYLARHGDGDPELAHTKLQASSTLFETVGAQREVERILAKKEVSRG